MDVTGVTLCVRFSDYMASHRFVQRDRYTSSGPTARCPDALELPLTIPAESARPPRWSRSCATAYELASSSVRPSERARGVGCWGPVVRAQSWRDSPASLAPRRNLRPQVATRSKWARIEALVRNRAFATEYAGAREQWRNGLPAVFPPGSYYLHRFASVPVLET